MSLQKLPEEIFEKILSYLNFNTLQKTCTLVCKEWRERIRNSSILSGEMTLNLVKNDASISVGWEKYSYKAGKELEINDVLSKWRKLHTLRVPCMMPDVDLSTHPYLRKVIVDLTQNLQMKKVNWIKVSKICYDPKNEPRFHERIIIHNGCLDLNSEQVIQLKLELNDRYITNFPILQRLEEIVSKMTNLESTVIQFNLEDVQDFESVRPVLRGLGSCPKLKESIVYINQSSSTDSGSSDLGPKKFDLTDSDYLHLPDSEVSDDDDRLDTNSLPNSPPIIVKQFFDIFVTHCPNIIKLEIRVLGGDDGRDDFYISWIPCLKNLEELTIQALLCFPSFESFRENPMMKLKRLKIDDSMVGIQDLFSEIHTSFPALESFEHINSDIAINHLNSVLFSVRGVKNLTISTTRTGYNNVAGTEWLFEEKSLCLETFKLAFQIIDQTFSKDNTEIELHEKVHGLWIKKEKGKSPELILEENILKNLQFNGLLVQKLEKELLNKPFMEKKFP